MLPLWIRESRQECIAFQVRNELKMLGFRSCLCRDCISRNQSPTLSLSNQKNKNTKVIYTMDFLVLNNSSFAKEIYQALHFSFILGFFSSHFKDKWKLFLTEYPLYQVTVQCPHHTSFLIYCSITSLSFTNPCSCYTEDMMTGCWNYVLPFWRVA